MNDPHVQSLHYRIAHSNSVSFEKASPLEVDKSSFSVRITEGEAEVVMKEHHASEASARAVVDPFLRAWELSAGLLRAQDDFKFVFHRAHIIDRKPMARALHAESLVIGSPIFTDAAFRVGRSTYPAPPTGLARDSTVDWMFDCYCLYCQNRRRLADAAYFCLTALERAAGEPRATKAKRVAAAKRFGIAKPVLDKIGNLTAAKGGREARKAEGAQDEFTNLERSWLTEAMKAMIRRAAEVAHDPDLSRDQITMADLPPLA